MQLTRLLQTLLEFIENVIVVRRLHLHEDLKNSEGVCVCIVIDHPVDDPTLFRWKKNRNGNSKIDRLMMTIKKWLKISRMEKMGEKT